VVHEAYVADTAPPPPRVAVYHARPGYIWVDGRWAYVDGEWVWREGHWVRERSGHVYVPGRWVVRGGRYHWVDGHHRPRRVRVYHPVR
jgi:hypothetical protein